MYLTTKYVSSPFNNTSQGPLLACHMFLYFSVVIVHIFCILLVKTIKHIIISYYHRIAVGSGSSKSELAKISELIIQKMCY